MTGKKKKTDGQASRILKRLSPSARRLQKAIQIFERGEQQEAFKIFATLANQSVPEAQYRVGRCYLSGEGVFASLEEGARWLCRAAENGWAEACFGLATLYVSGLPEGFDPAAGAAMFQGISGKETLSLKTDYRKALYWAGRGAEAGNANAQALIGFIRSQGPEELRDIEKAWQSYEEAAKGGAAQGYYGYGILLLGVAKTPKEYARAIDYLQKAAAQNVGMACVHLAQIYEKAIGTEQDLKKAADFYFRAAELGIASAQARYGIMLLKGMGVTSNKVQAESWLRRAAHNGDSDAAALLGDLYIRGDVFLQNSIEALKWYHIAAEKGHLPAARALAVMYFSGIGTAKNPQKAAQWFSMAAEQGDRYSDADLGNLVLSGSLRLNEEGPALQVRFQKRAEEGDQLAAFNLGVYLAQGLGGEKDEKKALFWLKRALGGVVNAQYWYGRLIFEAAGRLGDPVEGIYWIEKAAEAGMAEACAALAQIFVSGQFGVPQDHPRALQLYQKAAEQGSVDALFSLGAMYGGGHGVEENREKAQNYFEQAAEQGHALAQMMLGRYLFSGLGGYVDRVEAQRWLQRAADAGIEEAKENLRFVAEMMQQEQNGQAGGETGHHG